MFESLGRGVYRGRWSLLLLGLAFAVFAGVWGAEVFGRLADGGFEDPKAESTTEARWNEEWFGGTTPDVVVLYRHPSLTVTDQEFRDSVHGSLRALPRAPIDTVTTLWSSGAGHLASRDRHATYAVIKLTGGDQDKRRGFERIRAGLPIEGYEVRVGGAVPLLDDLNEQTARDLQRAEAIAMPVLLVLLVIVFGSLVAAGLPLVVGAVAVLGALALLRLLTEITDVSVFSINVVTMLGLGLAIDYSLFVLTAFREEIRRGRSTEEAVVRTMATAGRTVAFSGLTVATALCGLLLFPQMFLRSIGLGGAAVVVVAMLAALIVLPALLGVLGRRVDALRLTPSFGGATGMAWHRIASSVMRRPLMYLVGVTVVLMALAGPFLHVRFGNVDARVLPEGFESRQVAQTVERDFSRNAMSAIDVIVLVGREVRTVTTPSRPGPVGMEQHGIMPVTQVTARDVRPYVERLRTLKGVTGVDVTGVAQDKGAVRLAVRYGSDPMSDQTRDLVGLIRSLTLESGFRQVVVGGPTAAQLDLMASLLATLPWTGLVVCLVTGILLFAAFGSVVLPIKAILMNVLSLGASFGVIVWAFQEGHLAGVLGFTSTGTIEATVTVLILAVVFGLSMDYELFLLSRVRAEWLRTHDNTQAVAVGLQKTGGVITSAALLLLVVIAAFSTAGITIVKLLGVGMFVAIVVDATLVRALLVPATMRLLGGANWWLPGSLRRLHARVGLRDEPQEEPGGEPPDRDRVTVERERPREAAARVPGTPPPPQLTAAASPSLPIAPPPVPIAPSPSAPATPAPAPPVRTGPGGGRVIRPNLDGPGWHWAEEGEDTAPPEPLLTVEEAVRIARPGDQSDDGPGEGSGPGKEPPREWVPVGTARTKIVRPNPDGPGWHWAEVER
ncbi:MMPL family transporter [Sphaerisporangium flaviroseum]|uniref:MMPL family transporter n=1 Tax=Sphaerisporangium flaviroseum TaxID=509199 RepID=A0ABP7I267_9ACTN